MQLFMSLNNTGRPFVDEKKCVKAPEITYLTYVNLSAIERNLPFQSANLALNRSLRRRRNSFLGFLLKKEFLNKRKEISLREVKEQW